MSSPAVAEEIVLSSNQPQLKQKKIILRKVTLELLQKNRLDGVQKLFRVYDDRILSITEKTKKTKKNYVIALSLLDEKPRRKNGIDTKYVIAAIGLGLIAYTIHYLKSTGLEVLTGSNATYVKFALLSLCAGAVFCVFKMMKNSLVIKTANGQLPLVELYENRPNKPQCEKFLATMTEKIIKVKKSILMPSDQKFAVEISEHRRLRDEGVISEEQYEFAKSNIFENQALRNKSLQSTMKTAE